MPKATRALGTKLQKGATSPATIGGLTKIGGIEISADTQDITSLESEGGYREFIGTFKDGGEVPIEGFFNPDTASNQTGLQDSLDAGTADDWKILFPTTPAWEWDFKGVVTGFKVGDVETDGTINFATTIKVSGKPVLKQTTV
jgi:predicted secreted protein